MPQWIEILRAGDYAQGKITVEDLQNMSTSYNPAHLQAMFIPEHRMYNEQGELLNNMSALAWIAAVKQENESLYVLPEENAEERLRWYFDGISYRYCSAEIQYEEIDGKKTPYLSAVVPTNFPASRMAQIKLNAKKEMKIFSIEQKKGNNIMNKDQFIQLCAALGIPDTSSPDDAIVKLTELKASADNIPGLTDAITKISEALTAPNQLDAQLVQLTEKVTALETKLTESARDFTPLVDKAIAEKKLLPSQRDDMIAQFNANPEGFKKFSEKLPVIKVNADTQIPADKNGNPLKYTDLMRDPQKYNEVMRSNPDLFSQLRKEHYDTLVNGVK